MHKRIKLTFLWCLFIMIDIIIAAAISEVWIRNFIPVKNLCWTQDSEMGIKRCPNQRTYGYIEKDYNNIFVTNSLGFHDIERSKIKNKDTYRIHVYGDSIIAGEGVQTEDTIPSLLEKILNNDKFPYDIEVFNMSAVDSTSSALITYEKIGAHFNPDLVVCYFMDDFHDNIIDTHPKTYYPYHKIEGNGELIYIPPVLKDTSTLWERFKKSSMLYRLIANKILESKVYHDASMLWGNFVYYSAMMSKRGVDVKADNDPVEGRRKILIEKSWPLTLRLIEHYRDRVEKNGSTFVLVDGKLFNDLNVGTVYSNKDLEEFCRNKNINYIPVYALHDQLMSMPNKDEYFFRDNHPNPLGNKELSMLVAEGIKKILIGMK